MSKPRVAVLGLHLEVNAFAPLTPLSAVPVRARAAKIGYLPQQFMPHWDYQVREILQLGLERCLNSPSSTALGELAEAFDPGASCPPPLVDLVRRGTWAGPGRRHPGTGAPGDHRRRTCRGTRHRPGGFAHAAAPNSRVARRGDCGRSARPEPCRSMVRSYWGDE